MSAIVNNTANVLLVVFAGETVAQDTVVARIELEYALAKKRTGVSSFFQVENVLEANGVTSRYTGPDYTGDKFFTFPAA